MAAAHFQDPNGVGPENVTRYGAPLAVAPT